MGFLGKGLFEGMAVTARNFVGSYFDKELLTTVQYPEERVELPENSRSFPFLVFDNTADAMRCVIHVEDMAEAFARVLIADKPKHTTYNSGGVPISMGELAVLVREFLPDADIRFGAPTGGRAISGNFLIDNRRLIEEFGLQFKPLRQRVREVINDIGAGQGRPPIA